MEMKENLNEILEWFSIFHLIFVGGVHNSPLRRGHVKE